MVFNVKFAMCLARPTGFGCCVQCCGRCISCNIGWAFIGATFIAY